RPVWWVRTINRATVFSLGTVRRKTSCLMGGADAQQGQPVNAYREPRSRDSRYPFPKRWRATSLWWVLATAHLDETWRAMARTFLVPLRARQARCRPQHR